MKSGLNRDKYQNFSGIRTRVMNSLAIVANALTTGLFLTCHVKLLIHKVFRVVVNNLFESETIQREARTSRIGHGNRAFAPFITFLFLSILARMRGSRDLCVTPLLLGDIVSDSNRLYSFSLVTQGGLQDFYKNPKSARLCEKETICFNASPKSYEAILKEQKAMKLTFEILIPLSIFKTNRGCISNLYAARFEKNPFAASM